MSKLSRVLIAHQSAIPHYRVPFYNALEQLRPANWTFDVVFDRQELCNPHFFQEPLDINMMKFSIVDVQTYTVKLGGKLISYQTFWRLAVQYDLLIVENALNNLAYPLGHLHQLRGTKVAYWGHGWDHSVQRPSPGKSLVEWIKWQLAAHSDGFFAYTSYVKDYMVGLGMDPARVFVVNNTIDINQQRQAYEQYQSQRVTIKTELGLQNKKVLLYVGRLTANKRIDFLLQAFDELYQRDPDYHLLMVGDGIQAYLNSLDDRPGITCFGAVVDINKLAPIYIASDLFSFPGSVGLGPLQALCYDLPVITIESPTHGPEIEYLQPANSIILCANATPTQYADAIHELFYNGKRLQLLKQGTWPSVQHLTIEQMARNFILGIEAVLSL